MKVLITGATGFVGSQLAHALTQKENISEIHVLHRQNSDLSALKGLELKHQIGDVTDIESLNKAFLGMDSVFHLAGLIAYKSSERKKMDLVNVQGTQNVIEACLKNNVRKLLHMSSVTAIGASFTPSPLNEDSPYNISDLNLGYFETKHQAEECVHRAVREKNLDAVIVNPSTIYGPGDARKGSRKTQIKVAQEKFPFYTSGGVNVVSVEDVCQGMISAWEKGRTGERYILSGENLLIKDLFKIIAQEAGVKPPCLLLPKSVAHILGFIGDQLEKVGLKGPISSENAWTSSLFHWFDSSKAQKELDFRPKPARYAIAQSVQWMKDHQII